MLNKSQFKTIIKIAKGDKKTVEQAIKKARKIIKKGDYARKQVTRVYESAASYPDISEDELKEKVEEQRYEERLYIDLPYQYAKALNQAVEGSTGDIKDLILDIIRNWLSERGLVEEK